MLSKSVKIPNFDSSSPHITQWYTAVIDWKQKDFIPQESEVAEVRWWTPKELAIALRDEPNIFIKRMPLYFEMFHKHNGNTPGISK